MNEYPHQNLYAPALVAPSGRLGSKTPLVLAEATLYLPALTMKGLREVFERLPPVAPMRRLAVATASEQRRFCDIESGVCEGESRLGQGFWFIRGCPPLDPYVSILEGPTLMNSTDSS